MTIGCFKGAEHKLSFSFLNVNERSNVQLFLLFFFQEEVLKVIHAQFYVLAV